MENYYVIVAGNGKTSRVNVEVLLEDHYHANGDNGVLVVPFVKNPSEGQIWALQLAKARNKEAIVYASELANFTNIDSVSVEVSNNPIADAVRKFAKDKTAAFLLWSDEDEDCLNVLSECKKNKIPAFDLTEGLVQIKPNKDISVEQKETVEIPEQEKVTKKLPKHITMNVESDDDEDLSGDGDEDVLYAALDDIARVLATLLVKHLKDELPK